MMKEPFLAYQWLLPTASGMHYMVVISAFDASKQTWGR